MKPSIKHTWARPVQKSYIVRDVDNGVTRESLKLLKEYKNLLGPLEYLELIQPFGQEFCESLVRFIDKDGEYIELDGLAWGYGGEGPRGLATACKMFGWNIDIHDIARWSAEHLIIDAYTHSTVVCKCCLQ